MSLLASFWALQCPQNLHEVVMLSNGSLVFIGGTTDSLSRQRASKELLVQQVEMTVQLMESLGFTTNLEKSQLRPAQQIQFLGFILDSTRMKFFLPEEKLLGISQMCQSLLDRAKVSIWQRSQLSGRMAAASPAVLSAPLRYRQLQHFKIRSFRRFESFDALVTLDKGAIQDLQ